MEIDPKLIRERVIPNSLEQNAEVMLRATDRTLDETLIEMVENKLVLEKFQLQCLAMARLCDRVKHPKADEVVGHLTAAAAFAPGMIECVKVAKDVVKGN